jgi:hypothetical protein
MTAKDKEPLRGDAAWRAARQAIADRNEAAYARSRKERDERDAAAASRRHVQEKLDSQSTPKQPGRT